MTQVCSPEPNAVVLPEFRPFPALPPTNPDPSEIGPESWAGGERAIRDMMSKIQPTAATHRRRKDVIQYVQSLISCNVGCQVFPYGSVPLKTYLPDGDIDLTVFTGSAQLEDVFVIHVHAVLKGEENNEAAQYHVKDVHRIDAEVKLVKCIVENMIVDISFNQLGGLCTLSFLEQVDQYIGKDHIFKRSIILIKAWCYYESRILGAHHGLISTYALETLVLYIFHLFHSSLDGPLTVLYRFLDYFSKFDWENYCISLNGRVCKSSLPNIVAEVPDNGGDDVLLSEEFIRNCVYLFSVPSQRCETNLRVFPLKHLNIIDPLKENNNLGRSVNRGSFYRICSAFKYGARKLGWILSLPAERISDELNKFFANTLDRHESKCQTTVQNNALLELGDDFDSHCLNRQFSLIGHKCATSPPLLPSPPLSPQQWKENPWDVTCEALQSQHNINSQTTVNGISWGTHAYHTNGSNFYVPPFKEEKIKPRGTGTYIPNVSFQNYRPYKDRHLPGRGRKEAAGTYAPFQRHTFSYDFPAAPPDTISPGECNHELSEADFPVLSNSNSATSDYHQPQLSVWEPFHENGFSNSADKPESRSQRIRQKEVYELQKELILTSERVVLGTLAFYFNVHHPYKLLVEAIKKFKVAQNALAAKTKSRTEQQDLDHGSSDNIQASYEATSNSHLQAGCTISGTSRSASSPASEQSYVENDGPARSAGMTGALDQNLEVKDNQQSKVAEAQTLSKSVSEGRSEEGQVRESNDRKGEIREGGDKHLGRNLDNTHSALGRSPQEAIKKVNKDKVRAALENCEGKPLLM